MKKEEKQFPAEPSSISRALDAMPDSFILKPLLAAYRDEVTEMLLTEYDDQKEAEIHDREVSEAEEKGKAEGIVQGKAEGIKKGKEETTAEIVDRMLKAETKLSDQEISYLAGIPLQKVEERRKAISG